MDAVRRDFEEKIHVLCTRGLHKRDDNARYRRDVVHFLAAVNASSHSAPYLVSAANDRIVGPMRGLRAKCALHLSIYCNSEFRSDDAPAIMECRLQIRLAGHANAFRVYRR